MKQQHNKTAKATRQQTRSIFITPRFFLAGKEKRKWLGEKRKT